MQLTVRYLTATIHRNTQNAEPEIRTDRSSQPRANPAGWRLWVRVWPTKRHQVGCLDGSRTELTHLYSPNPDPLLSLPSTRAVRHVQLDPGGQSYPELSLQTALSLHLRLCGQCIKDTLLTMKCLVLLSPTVNLSERVWCENFATIWKAQW